MTTLILACILNITPTNPGTTKYMPVSVATYADADNKALALKAECVKTFGEVELAYIVKESL